MAFGARGVSAQVSRGAALQILARVFSASVTLIVTAVLLARWLPETEYGLYQFYVQLYLLAMTLVDCGVNRAAIRRVSAGEASAADAMRAAIGFKSAFGWVAFVLVAGAAALGEDGALPRVLLVVAAAHMLSHGLSAASIGFEVELDFRVPAQGVLLGYGVFLLGSLALYGGGVVSAPPYLVAFGAGLAVQNAYLHARARRRFALPRRAPGDERRALLREALPLGLSAAAVAIYFYVDTLLLRPLRGEEDVARYAVAYRLMTFGLMLPVLFSQVLFPVFARCHAHGAPTLSRVVGRSTFYLAFAAAAAAPVLAVLAPDLLALVYGERYRDSAPVLRLLVPAMVAVYLAYPHTTALIAAGRAATFTRITVAGALLNVAGNLLVIPRFGPEGAAATTLATEAFVLGAGAWSARRLLGVNGFSRALLGPLALAAALTLLLLGPLAPLPLVLRLGAAVVVAGAGALALRAWPFSLGVDEALAMRPDGPTRRARGGSLEP